MYSKIRLFRDNSATIGKDKKTVFGKRRMHFESDRYDDDC